MVDERNRVEHLLQLRETVFAEMEEADREFTALRMRVERMESDLRVGRPEPPEYQETKGRLLPQAEARVIDLFTELLKLEDKIKLAAQ